MKSADLKTITLRKGAMTAAKRLSPIQQVYKFTY